MKIHAFRILSIGLPLLLLNGCMMGMGGVNHGDPQEMRGSTKEIEKDFPEKNIRLNLTVPPLAGGNEAMVAITARRMQDNSPVTGAAVSVLIERTKMDEAGQTEIQKIADEHASEIPGTGEYRVRQRINDPGTYRILVRVRTEGMEPSADPLLISATREAGGNGSGKAGDSAMMTGVLGAIGMGIMMLFMVH